MAYLVVERGVARGTRIQLQEFPISVGRDAHNDVVIDDSEISRRHFRLKQRGRLYIIEDLDSRNGTYLNGDKIKNSIIKNGNKILVGSTEISFLASEPEIQLANEVLKFDMIVNEDLGIDGPIDVSSTKGDQGFSPTRFDPRELIDAGSQDATLVRKTLRYAW